MEMGDVRCAKGEALQVRFRDSQHADIAQLLGDFGGDFVDIVLEWKVKDAQDIGGQFDITLTYEDNVLSTKLAHEPSQFQDHILTCSSQGFGLVLSGNVVGRYEHEGKGGGCRPKLKLLNDGPATMGLLAENHRLESQSGQQALEL